MTGNLILAGSLRSTESGYALHHGTRLVATLPSEATFTDLCAAIARHFGVSARLAWMTGAVVVPMRRLA